MEMLSWIDVRLSEIEPNLLFKKYFDSFPLQEGGDGFYILNPSLGIDIILRRDQTVRAIHFYSGNQEGAQQYVDNLPFNLSFSFSRDKTRSILGQPTETGGGGYSFLYDVVPDWDMYVYDSYLLHLQFLANNKGINLVTIDSPIARYASTK